MEARIRQNNSDQPNPRKVKSLGDHLGSQQNIDTPGAENVQGFLKASLLPVVSASERRMRRSGKVFRTSSSIISVPKPVNPASREPHWGQALGGTIEYPQ